ncbi:MAG: RagB/SusD family nutrient uptake outer membrane protein [Bacteroidaceae bacterium]|nr:RagB/SusD family nutrient uptake outer membrane protein [Bacteroidaceae bacterium]
MKKVYISLMLLLGLLSSCSMDKSPYGVLDETTAIQNMNDLARLRNGAYTRLRSMTAGTWVTYSDIQMDQFHGLTSNGNRVGIISNGLITSSQDDIEGFFRACYAYIADMNYLIEQCDKFAATMSEADQPAIARYKAEACFTRAFAYFYLIDHYCQPYAKVDPTAAHTGVQIVTKYEPTGDVTKYPSRSTLEESYALVENDLETAYNGLKAYEAADDEAVAPNAAYLSSYAVAAMQARVALIKGDYDTAKTKADEVIGSGKYALTEIDDYEKLWTNDEGTEVLFRPVMSNVEGLVSTGEAYTASSSETSADYIATTATLALYSDGDVRFDAFFKVWNLDIEGTQVGSYVFLKYPGNASLRTGSENNYVNMPKPFRLSEMYLVAAEAAAKTNADASPYLNALMAKRITGYMDANYPVNTVMDVIKAERQRELLGEGFRMSDLRRWNDGFKRDGAHLENPALDPFIVAAGANLGYAADDYRFTWPIPKTEIDSNPNVAGQQNPGY